MLKLAFRNFTLLVDGPIGVAALIVVAAALATSAWGYVHHFLR